MMTVNETTTERRPLTIGPRTRAELRRRARELEARLPRPLTNAGKRELATLQELLREGGELTPERAQGVADTLTPRQMARAIRHFDKLMRTGVGREEALVLAIATEVASGIEAARAYRGIPRTALLRGSCVEVKG
jgi:hypothetical protein